MVEGTGRSTDPAGSMQQPPLTLPDASRTLPDREYRDWVHDQVARSLYTRLGRIASAIGIAGIVLLGGLGARLITNEAEKTRILLHEQVREQLDRARTEVTQGTEGLIKGEVASTLLREADLRKTLKEAAVEEAKGIAEKIVKDELDEPGGLEAALFRRLHPVVRGDQPAPIAQREQALRLMVIFASDQDDLNSELLPLLASGRQEDRDLRKLPLSVYTPSDNVEAETQVIQSILNVAKNDLAIDFHEWSTAYIEFLSRFSANAHVDYLGSWIAENADAEHTSMVAQALALCQSDYAISALARLFENEDLKIASMGWNGMGEVEPSRQIDQKVRESALRSLWSGVEVGRYPARRVSPVNLQRLREDLRSVVESYTLFPNPYLSLSLPLETVPEITRERESLWTGIVRRYLARLGEGGVRLERLGGESPFFTLFRLQDWDDLTEPWLTGTGERDGLRRAGADLLASDWTSRLEFEGLERQEVRNHLGKLAQALIGMGDALYWAGTAKALGTTVRSGDVSIAAAVLDAAPSLYRGDVDPETNRPFVGHGVLLEGLRFDAGPEGVWSTLHGWLI